MIELVLAQAAQQATGIPAEVWIAIIGAISGSLIKPIFDLVSQRITAQRDAERQTEESVILERERLQSKIESLRAEIEAVQSKAQLKVDEARDAEDVWREKYFAALERFNQVYGGASKEPGIDLSNPSVLKEIIKHIAAE